MKIYIRAYMTNFVMGPGNKKRGLPTVRWCWASVVDGGPPLQQQGFLFPANVTM